MGSSSVVLFDGVCNLCNASVGFVLDHERAPELRFAPLQSDAARRLLEQAVGSERARELQAGTGGDDAPGSVVLVEDARAWTGSTAALRIARRLRAPWRWLFAFVVVPRPIRDLVYALVAKNRYRWFGKTAACRVPTPELRARFLE